jgi:hypothetical protein
MARGHWGEAGGASRRFFIGNCPGGPRKRGMWASLERKNAVEFS